MALEDKVSFCPECWKNEYLFKPGENPKHDICDFCGAKLLHTDLTAEEHYLIQHISKDHDFMMAMIDLKKNDIIEYQTKIAQYKQIAKANGCYTSPTEKARQNQPKCPTCGSTNIEKISIGKKAFGGMMFGIFSSDVRKSMHCKNCGYKW